MLTLTCEHCGTIYQRAKGDEGRGRFCSNRCGRLAQPLPTKAERFWRKITITDGCWKWAGGTNPNGYGLLYTGSRETSRGELAHRISWELHNGPIPADLWVLHRCDNPPCCNPAHLFLGTAADNAHDRDRKGRQVTVGDHIKVTPEQVRDIRAAVEAGETFRPIATRYGITKAQVSRIVNRRAWKHVE